MILLIACNKSNEEDLIFQDPPPDYLLRVLKYFDESGNQMREIRFDYDTDGNWIDSGNIYNNVGQLVESAWPGPWHRPYLVKYHYNEFDMIDTITGMIPSHRPQVIFHYRIRKLERISLANNATVSQSFVLGSHRDDGIKVSLNPQGSAGIFEENNRTYHFDNGRSPFPRAYLLKNSWYPIQIENLISDHNLLEITTASGDRSEILESYTYEYDNYGFPVVRYASDGSRVTFTYQ